MDATWAGKMRTITYEPTCDHHHNHNHDHNLNHAWTAGRNVPCLAGPSFTPYADALTASSRKMPDTGRVGLGAGAASKPPTGASSRFTRQIRLLSTLRAPARLVGLLHV